MKVVAVHRSLVVAGKEEEEEETRHKRAVQRDGRGFLYDSLDHPREGIRRSGTTSEEFKVGSFCDEDVKVVVVTQTLSA